MMERVGGLIIACLILFPAFACQQKKGGEEKPVVREEASLEKAGEGVSPSSVVSPKPAAEGAEKPNSPPVITRVAIVPDPARVSDSLRAEVEAADTDGDAISLEYTWIKNGTELPNHEATLPAGSARKGEFVGVMVVPSDGKSQGGSVMSPQVSIQNSPPQIASSPPAGNLGPELEYTYKVSAQDPDEDPLRFSLAKAPPGMTIDPTSGLIKWKPDTKRDSGDHEVEVVVEDGDRGRQTQKYTLTLSFSVTP